MNGSLILLILAVVPMLCAPLAWALGRRGRPARHRGDGRLLGGRGGGADLYHSAGRGRKRAAADLGGLPGQGIRMRADGFRALYAMIASVMWLVTSLFSRDYLRHDHADRAATPSSP